MHTIPIAIVFTVAAAVAVVVATDICPQNSRSNQILCSFYWDGVAAYRIAPHQITFSTCEQVTKSLQNG